MCHNSFQNGLAKQRYKAEELCLNLYYFFNRSSCRRKDLCEIEEYLGLDEMVTLHHVQSHWLSLVPALQHVVAIKSVLKKLLPEELPKNYKSTVNNDRYIAIEKALASREIEIEFLFSIRPLFDDFMTKFQMEEPMIHLPHPSYVKLLKVALGRLLKSNIYIDEKVKALKEIDPEKVKLQLKNDHFKAMQCKQNATKYFMHIFNIKYITMPKFSVNSFNWHFSAYISGHSVSRPLDGLPEGTAKKALMGMRSFFKAVITHLQKLPIDILLLSALICLNPRE